MNAVTKSVVEPVALSHVGIRVADVQRSLDFYRRVFGYKLFYDNHATGSDERVLIGVIADVALELVHKPNSPPFRMSSNANGYCCVTFSVKDVDVAYSALSAQGLANLDAPVTLPSGVRTVLFQDPDGNLVELIDLKGPISLAEMAKGRPEITE